MFRRVILSLFLACVTVVAMATSAEAHATLVSTSPTDGGTVSASPQQVQLTFDDVVNLGPDAVQVTAADGGREDKADAGVTSDGKTVIESLKPNLGNGIHKVGWRITSDDGHIIDGTFSFKVAVPAPSVAPSAPAQNATASVLLDDRLDQYSG